MAYLIVGTLETMLPATHDKSDDGNVESLPQSVMDALWHDIGRFAAQWAVMLSLAALYLGLQAWLPLPAGCPTGYTGAGGLADGGSYLGLGCTGGAHRVIDMAIFGAHHIYHNNRNGAPSSSATCSDPYLCDGKSA